LIEWQGHAENILKLLYPIKRLCSRHQEYLPIKFHKQLENSKAKVINCKPEMFQLEQWKIKEESMKNQGQMQVEQLLRSKSYTLEDVNCKRSIWDITKIKSSNIVIDKCP